MIRTCAFFLISLFPLAADVYLTADPYFSPNSDGIRDTLTIKVDSIPSDLRRCKNWRVEISSASGIVRTLHADRRKKNLPGLAFTASERLRVFRSLIWDGRDDQGRLVGDGVYDIWLKIDTLAGDTITSQPLRVTASTRKPGIQLSSDQSILKRNLDSSGNVISENGPVIIAQNITEGMAYRFEGAFLNASGSVIEKRKWEQEMPVAIEWNGRSAWRKAPLGVYRYRLTAEDAAGNRNVAFLNDIIITDQDLEIDLRADRYFFSPEARANIELDPVHINPVSGRTTGSAAGSGGDWEFRISRGPGRKPLFVQQGQSLPSKLVWNGLNEDGKPVSAGVYYAHLTRGDSRSIHKPIFIDRSAPSVSIGVGWNDLSPDGDGSNDQHRISLGARDNYDLESWTLYISIEPDASLLSPHRTLQGQGAPPSRFYWDGLGDNGERLESLERVAFQLEAKDRAGNVSRSRVVYRQTGVLLRPIQPGSVDLVSRVPDYKFFSPLDQLTGAGRSKIRSISRALSSYKKYFVRVESHSSMRGGEEENLLQSEFRAGRAHAYFLSRGFATDRIDFRGLGETEPLREDSSSFFDYRNSRLEVRLTEKKEL